LVSIGRHIDEFETSQIVEWLLGQPPSEREGRGVRRALMALEGKGVLETVPNRFVDGL